MRLIDADALLYEYDAQHEGSPGRARAMIENAPTVNGWISVKKRLPTEEDYKPCRGYLDGVVLWFNGFESGFGWYYPSTESWADLYDRGIINVTHWMPLPKPPKTEK